MTPRLFVRPPGEHGGMNSVGGSVALDRWRDAV